MKKESQSQRVGLLVKGRNSELLHAIQYRMTSKARLEGAGEERGGGWAGGGVCGSQQIRALPRLVLLVLPRPECSLQMSRGQIVFYVCFCSTV